MNNERGMKRLYIVACFVIAFFLYGASSVQAALLKFDQTTLSTSVGQTFSLQTIVDAQSDQITSTDIWITYDPTLLEAQVASAGAFFPAVTSNITSGKVYVAGLITDPGSYKTSSGTVATVTFKALKNGTATVAYDCRTDVSNSSKVIKNAVDPTNVIVCSQNGTSVVTIGTGGTITPSVTPIITSSIATTSQIQPTALPQTGLMDQLPKMGTIGALLLLFGVALRLLIL